MTGMPWTKGAVRPAGSTTKDRRAKAQLILSFNVLQLLVDTGSAMLCRLPAQAFTVMVPVALG